MELDIHKPMNSGDLFNFVGGISFMPILIFNIF